MWGKKEKTAINRRTVCSCFQVDKYLKEILQDVMSNLTSNAWRVRESRYKNYFFRNTFLFLIFFKAQYYKCLICVFENFIFTMFSFVLSFFVKICTEDMLFSLDIYLLKFNSKLFHELRLFKANFTEKLI